MRKRLGTPGHSLCLCQRLLEERIVKLNFRSNEMENRRKHAFVASPGQVIEPPVLQRCWLDPVIVDHFLDFISSPTFLQDVAYGTKTLKLSSGEKIEIPNVVRTVVASCLIQLYQSYCKEYEFAPLGQSTLFSIVKGRRLSLYLSWYFKSLEGKGKYVVRLKWFML